MVKILNQYNSKQAPVRSAARSSGRLPAFRFGERSSPSLRAIDTPAYGMISRIPGEPFLFVFEWPQTGWHPEWPDWKHFITWQIRNPFSAICIGFSTDAIDFPNFVPDGGWQVLIHESDLPFIAYRGRYIEFYAGWRPNGSFGLALGKAHARNERGISGK